MTQDEAIMCALVKQVAKAANNNSETCVTTFITCPMWNAHLRAVGIPENSEPTKWLGLYDTIRVYGSETIVVESDKIASMSFRKK